MATNWQDEYLQMIEDCLNRESRMNNWENTFIDSLSHQINAGKTPSPKQIEVLDRIWEKCTAKG